MTQKKIGDILYVFSTTPYEITQDTTATTIYVQEELLAGYKTVNASLASKIKPFNYHVLVATPQPWNEYVEAKYTPSLAWSVSSATVTINSEENVFPTLTNTEALTVSYLSSDETVATIASDGTITLVATGTTNISVAFTGNDDYEAKTATYALTVEAAQSEIEVGS